MADEKMMAAWSGTFESLRNYKNIPGTILRDLVDFFVDGRKTGGHFVQAVLTNDLAGAYQHGDLSSLRGLWALMTWLYNRAPRDAFGTVEKVTTWPGYRNLIPATTFSNEVIEIEVRVYRQRLIEGTVLDEAQC